MSLQELYQKLNVEFPLLRFHRSNIFGKECVTSNYGRKQFIAIKVSENGEFKMDHSELYKLGISSTIPNYETMISTIAAIVKTTNPELVPIAQLSIFTT